MGCAFHVGFSLYVERARAADVGVGRRASDQQLGRAARLQQRGIPSMLVVEQAHVVIVSAHLRPPASTLRRYLVPATAAVGRVPERGVRG
jgi:hypothetical protein